LSKIRDELRAALSANEEELRLPPPNPILLQLPSNSSEIVSGISRTEMLAEVSSSERHSSSMKFFDKSTPENHSRDINLLQRSEINSTLRNEWAVEKSSRKGAWRGYGKLPSVSSEWTV